MNIAIMCNMLCHHTLTTRAELINMLVEEGHEVFVFGIDEPEKDSSDNVQFVAIKASRNNINPLKELRSMESIRRNVQKNKIDATIIYGVKNHSAMAIGSYLAGCSRILCVVNGSGNLFRLSGWKGKLVRMMAFPMLRIAYKLSKNICFQNADDKCIFEKNQLVKKDGDKLFVTGGSGANLDYYSYKPLSSENRFLFLSRITPTKGVYEYVDSARIVKNRYPDVVFDIVGPIDSAVENGVENYLQKAVGEKIVNYHGATTDVPAWLEKCRFFVYPSYYPEGVPRCAIQAIATGRPIITCNTPGCKETVVDGINGFAVNPQNSDALAEKMIWMLEHPVEVEMMAVKSRQYAETKFDVNQINQVLYTKLLA